MCWGRWLCAAIIAALLSVHCEPCHMSAGVKQLEREDGVAITAWERGETQSGRREDGGPDKSSLKLWFGCSVCCKMLFRHFWKTRNRV